MPPKEKTHNYHGRFLTTKEIAAIKGITTQALYSRMNAHKDLTIAEAADMSTCTRGHRHAQIKHQVGSRAMTLSEWTEYLNVKYSTLVKWVRDEGIAGVVNRIESGQEQVRKEHLKSGKKRQLTPDTKQLEYEPDLELKRRIAAYRKRGESDSVILDRERRAFGNMR